jgi:hypothetical protein
MSVHQRFLRGSLLGALLAPLALVLSPAPAGAQWQPTITWNTFLGGGTLPDGGVETNRDDQIEDVAIASDGDVIVTGWTEASTFPATPPEGLPTPTTSRRDVFVARYSPDGQTLRWARVFGGSEDDVGKAVAVTTGGVVFVVGRTRSSTINIAPGTPVSLATRYSYQGRVDAFLARLEADGTLDYFMYLGSTLDDEAEDLVLSASGNVAYIVGKTGRDDGTIGGRSDATPIAFPPNNSLSNVRYRAFEAFVSQVDVSSPGDALVQWTRILRSNENDVARSVSVQGDTLYVGGTVGDELFRDPGTQAVNSFNQGNDDGFVARLQSDAGITWFRHVGGSGDDDDVRAALARPGLDDGVMVVGNTNSSGSPVAGSGTDVFVLRLDGNGAPVGGGLRLSTTGNGTERTEGHAAMDPYGNVYIGGRTSSSAGFARNAFDSALSSGGNNTDGFIAMVDPEGQFVVTASYVGGQSTSEEWVQGVAVGSGGRVAFGGYSNAAGWLSVNSGVDLTANGGTDGFAFNMLVDTTAPTAGTVSAQLAADGTLTVSWGGFNDPETPLTYEWGIGVVPGDVGRRAYEFVSTRLNATLTGFLPTEEGPFYVTVRATNAAGQSVAASSSAFRLPPRPDAGADGGTSDGGTSDGGVDAGSGDGGTDDGEGDDLSPVGWSCASGGGAGSLALTGLLVMLVLLAMRRERSAGVPD